MTAARLAAHGATGPATVLEGRRGLYGAYLSGAHADVEGQLSDLGALGDPRDRIQAVSRVSLRARAVDALAQILGEVTLEAEDVAEILAFSDETGVPLVLDPLEDKLRREPPTTRSSACRTVLRPCLFAAASESRASPRRQSRTTWCSRSPSRSVRAEGVRRCP